MNIRPAFVLFTLLIGHGISAQQWLWSRQIGGPGSEEVFIAGVDASSSVYLYGNYAWDIGSPPGFEDLYIAQDTLHGYRAGLLAKYEEDGDLAWVRNLTSPAGWLLLSSAVLDTLEEKLYVVGYYTLSCTLDTITLTAPFGGAFLSQWDLDGHCLWARNVATNGYDPLYRTCEVGAVAFGTDGRLFVGGTTPQYGPNLLEGRLVPQGTFVVSYTPEGDTLWTRMIAQYEGIRFSPAQIRTWNDHLFTFCGLYLLATTDTLTVGTTVLTNVTGNGYALFSIDATSGSLEWFRADGFSHAGANNRDPQRLFVDSIGHLYLVGGYVPISIIAGDTLPAANEWQNAFIARYDSSGNPEWVRTFEASEGAYFTAVAPAADGKLIVTGFVEGVSNWDGIEVSTSTQELVLSLHSPSGECLGVIAGVGPAIGASISTAPDGASYVVVNFPFFFPLGPPFEPITIGGVTYSSYGWQDALIAKHDLVTGIVTPKATENTHLVIYANPNRGSFTLQLPDVFTNERGLVLHIYDGTGHLVLEQALDPLDVRTRMDVFDASPGFYMVTLTNGRRTLSSNMVVE